MKAIVLAAAIAAAAVSPALAKSANTAQHLQHLQHLRQSQRVLDARAAFMTPDPYGVYVDGREIGRDPDPNVRSSLRNEYYEQQGQ
jgi:hypothetical protein